jgi:hypothetical protein
MVKGLARRVVVVKAPDRRLFEEAIFILREDADRGLSAQDIVEQARGVAAEYAKSSEKKRMLPGPALYVLVASLSCLAGYALGAWL